MMQNATSSTIDRGNEFEILQAKHSDKIMKKGILNSEKTKKIEYLKKLAA